MPVDSIGHLEHTGLYQHPTAPAFQSHPKAMIHFVLCTGSKQAYFHKGIRKSVESLQKVIANTSGYSTHTSHDSIAKVF